MVSSSVNDKDETTIKTTTFDSASSSVVPSSNKNQSIAALLRAKLASNKGASLSTDALPLEKPTVATTTVFGGESIMLAQLRQQHRRADDENGSRDKACFKADNKKGSRKGKLGSSSMDPSLDLKSLVTAERLGGDVSRRLLYS